MDTLIHMWELNYYTELLLLFFLCVSLVISIRQYKKYPQLKFLPLYLGSFCFLYLMDYTYQLILQDYMRASWRIIDILLNFFVTVTEFAAFVHFFYSIVNGPRFRTAIKVLAGIGVFVFLLAIVQILSAFKMNKYSLMHGVYIVESILLLVMCSFYYIELFKFLPVAKLRTSTNFWVSTGVTFYLISTLPFTIITDHIYFLDEDLYRHLFSLIYVFYCGLFVMVIKGYRCSNSKV